MKKYLFILLIIFISNYAYSQNNGQFFENSVIKIQYIGYNNGNHIFLVENKTNCPVLIKVDKTGSFQSHTVQGNSLFSILIPASSSNTIVKFKVKREGGPSCSSNPDNGWIELESPGPILNNTGNIKIISINRLPNNKVKVLFECNSNIDIKEFRIKTSKTSENFKVIKVIPKQNTKFYEVLF